MPGLRGFLQDRRQDRGRETWLDSLLTGTSPGPGLGILDERRLNGGGSGPMRGLLDRPFVARLGEHSDALLGAGGALLDGGPDAWSNAAAGWAAGSQLDRQRADDQRQQEDRRRLEKAVGTATAGAPPELQPLFTAAPQLGAQYAIDQFAPTTGETTDDITEYNYYAQQERTAGREPVPFAEWFELTRRPSTVINNNLAPDGRQFPAPPFGQDYQRNPDGTVRLNPDTNQPEIVNVPGGEQDIEAQRLAEAAQAELEYQLTQAPIVLGKIEQAISTIQNNPLFTTAWLGQRLANLGFTAAVDLRENLQTIISDIAIDRIMQMKAASPTGATGFGQLNEAELNLLTSTLGSLLQAQSSTQLLENLRELERYYTSILDDLFMGAANGVGNGAAEPFNPARGQPGAAQAAPLTAVNPATGERLQWNPATQQWEPVP